MKKSSPPPVQLRAGRGTDFEACIPLIRQLWPKLSDAEELAPVFTRLAGDPDCRVTVAEAGGQVVGLLDLTFRRTLVHRGLTAVIEDVVVDQDHRRRGIGSLLVRQAETQARERSCRAVELSSGLDRDDARDFWSALGYDRRAYRFGKKLA